MEGFKTETDKKSIGGEPELELDNVVKREEVSNVKKPEELSREKDNLVADKRDELFKIFDDKKDVNLEKKEVVKDGVDFVFEETPELALIGTKEQYSEYLNVIFPNSKIKDIVYHGSFNEEINSFLPGKIDVGIHFGSLNAAKYKGEKSSSFKIYPSMLNATKIKDVPELNMWTPDIMFKYMEKEGIIGENEKNYFNSLYEKAPLNNYRDNKTDSQFEYIQNKLGVDTLKYTNNFEDKGSISYLVFSPNQIQILDSKQDIINFIDFIKSNRNSSKNLSIDEI